MSGLALVFAPAALGVFASFVRGRSGSALLLVFIGVLATLLTFYELWQGTSQDLLGGYFRIDESARFFLAFVNPIFLGIALYKWGRTLSAPELAAGMRTFVPCAALFLSATNAVLMANHLLLAWIALELSTLAIAPLIMLLQGGRSVLASWRYLLFSTVGLAFVLLGVLCLMRGLPDNSAEADFFFSHMQAAARDSRNAWEQLGITLVLLGLGTKLGLAPMYSWLPEAYDEAPPAVAALLGGVQFNAALLLLVRLVHVFRPQHGQLITSTLLAMGLVSMAVSTAGIVSTTNMKRLIAYASINHAGVIAIGIGIGRDAAYGVLLYVISNAFIKTILFLTAGKIEALYNSKDTTQVAGLLKDLPYSGTFLMIGTFALLGLPPFGSFFGELLVLSALVGSGQIFVFAAFCVLITIAFVATGRTVFPMIWGEPKQSCTWPRQNFLSAFPKLVFLVALVVLGLYIPAPVNTLMRAVAQTLGGP